MTEYQFYTLLITAASASVGSLGAVVAVFIGMVNNNKRLDDLIGRVGRIEGTMDAMRQDISDIKRDLRGHDVEIGNLKERLKS